MGRDGVTYLRKIIYSRKVKQIHSNVYIYIRKCMYIRPIDFSFYRHCHMVDLLLSVLSDIYVVFVRLREEQRNRKKPMMSWQDNKLRWTEIGEASRSDEPDLKVCQ